MDSSASGKLHNPIQINFHSTAANHIASNASSLRGPVTSPQTFIPRKSRLENARSTLFSLIILLPIVLTSLANGLEAQPAYKKQIQELPNPIQQNQSFVYDGADILGQEKSRIDAICKAMYDAGGAQITVVTLKSIGDANIEEFAVDLFAHWGIGEAGKDNGILVLQVTDSRKIRIEVGYGLEGILPDAKANWIIQDVAIPYFKKGEFGTGHYFMVQSLIRILLNPNISREEIIQARETIEPGQTIARDSIPDQLYLSSKEERETQRNKQEEESEGLPWISFSVMILGVALGGWFLIRIVSRVSRLKNHTSPGHSYGLIDDAVLDYTGAPLLAGLGLVGAEIMVLNSFWLTIAIPFLIGAGWVWHDRHLKLFRRKSRKCPECGSMMSLLSEEQEDRYLKEGQIAEEKAGTVDYDVWICKCGTTQIERYKSTQSSVPCPSCEYHTYELQETRTIKKPDYENPGTGEKIYRCSHCEYESKETFSIDRLKRENETASGIATTLAGAAITAALYETRHGAHSYSAGSSHYSRSPSDNSAFEIPDDFGGGESGGAGATGDY
ncbi:MAG TPA: hypothetical protein DEA96_00920 [Leptospiraceae bacterium]|nr:hypothetical protein [Spirochaetaceae bacterium]HBS03494.1 hypothetical protein [Leptospiraceae bacterium]|tara:strand:+ start:16095 stop:17762 length:1668 start_codon:yes stop_codon:yes gene_type:complete